MSLRHVEREDASGLTQTCPLPPEIRRAAHVAAVLGSSNNGLINFTLISLLINGDLVIVISRISYVVVLTENVYSIDLSRIIYVLFACANKHDIFSLFVFDNL